MPGRRTLTLFLLHDALKSIWQTVARANEYVDRQAPWKLAKDPASRAALESTLASLVRQLARQAVYLWPFMPKKSEELWKSLGAPGSRLDIADIGPAILHGPMVEALQGSARDLAKVGLARTMRRVGFQAHDGRIFEALVARGGILVAIHSEPRAADALAVLFSYGGGNAAIGAWTGRV